MKTYKIRMRCGSFKDVIVKAKNEEEAIKKAKKVAMCEDYGMEFEEFLFDKILK